MGTAKATAIFDGDDSKILEVAKRIDEKLLETQERFAKAFEFGKSIAEGIALVEVVKKIGEGIRGAFETGSGLAILSNQTGIAVKDLAILQQQFREADQAGEDLGKTIGEMQKVIALGSADSTFATIGLQISKLREMAPAEQFQAIGQAINRINDPAQKTAAAMEIFGKNGAKMLAVFAGSGFEDAGAHVGEQADLLEKDAELFDDVATKLNLAGLKTQGFFVGIADKVAGVIKPMLDRFATLDLSGMGQQIGDMLAFSIQAVADGDVGELMLDALEVSFATAANFLAGALLAIPALIGDGLMKAAAMFISYMLDKTATVLDAFAKLPGGKYATEAAGMLRTAKGGVDDYSTRNLDLGKTFSDAMRMGHLIDIDPLSEELASVVSRITDNANSEQAKALAEASGKKKGGLDVDLSNVDTSGVSALQRIGGAFGGGSGAEAQLAEAQRQTDILSDIRGLLSAPESPKAARTDAYG